MALPPRTTISDPVGTGSQQNAVKLPGLTYVPNPGKADGSGGSATNQRIVVAGPQPTFYIPNPGKADGAPGTGTNQQTVIARPQPTTYTPNPNKADGKLGTGTNQQTIVARPQPTIYVPDPNKADGQGEGGSGLIPSAPSALDFDPSTRSDQVTLNWTNGSMTGTSNVIWKSFDGGITYGQYASIAGNLTTWIDAASMLNGEIWHYKVLAANSNGSSGFTNTVGCSNNYTSANVASISFPTLLLEYQSFTASGLAALTSVSMPLLRSVGATFNLSSNSSLASLNLNSLATVGNSFFLGDSQPVILSFPALSAIGTSGNAGDFQVHGNTHCTTLSCPNLQTVANNLTMYGMTALTSVSFPLLSGVGEDGLLGRLDFSLDNHLTTISFPSLTGVWTEIDFGACTLLVSVHFPVLVSIGSGGDIYAISGSTCPAMTTWDAPNFTSIPDLGLSVDFTGNALTAASINQILHTCALSNLSAGSNVNLNGGTNAAPTGQGVTDKNTLVANGATVVTN